jgi:shikimate dehydrogenase
MQNAAFRALDLDWTYELLDVAPEDLSRALQRLREDDCGGANVTIPHKQAVMEHLDAVDDVAIRCRAVNAIVNDAGRLRGYNTDVAGVRHALDDLDVDAHGANAVILGAGGAARAAAQALEGAHLTFVTRHPDEADVPGRTFGWTDPGVVSLTRAADVLVNATPLGRREEMPLRPGALPRQGAVLDLVYVTGGTPLVRKARSVGLRAADGWEVLLWQGASAFELWTQKRAPVEAMRDTLRP